MKLSIDKISHIAHLLKETALQKHWITTRDESLLLKLTKKTLTDCLQLEDEIDQAVRTKIESYSRNIPQGSREWDILYKKHYEEEKRKR